MSTLRVTTLATQAGVEVYTAKAWVNFDGTGTVAIRASGNVSSITDNGTGVYTVNFTTAMSDTNYSFVSSARATVSVYVFVCPQLAFSKTVSALQISVISEAGALTDSAEVNVAIFR